MVCSLPDLPVCQVLIHKYGYHFIVRIERSNNINVSIRNIVSYDTPFTSNA